MNRGLVIVGVLAGAMAVSAQGPATASSQTAARPGPQEAAQAEPSRRGQLPAEDELLRRQRELEQKLAKVQEQHPELRGQIEEARARGTARGLMQRSARFLLSAQEPDGGWAAEVGPGITCLVLKALIQEPSVGPHHPAVARGIELVRKSMREDGGIYSAEGLLRNYESSVALSMFAALEARAAGESRPTTGAVRSDSYVRELAALQKFLKDNQWDEGEGKSRDDPWYGGAGYGPEKRPDLSNTQIMLEALRDSGLPKDDPAYQKALVFIQRCQMLGERNDQPFARGSSQGGFIYTPANGGESKAGEIQVDGRSELRCYGSMTYAGFKSMLYAGLKRDDPRVRAALDWIRRYWTLDYNPNMPGQQSHEGVYYYYHLFGRTMEAWGEDVLADASGQPHRWRQELVEKLARLQRSDGSWLNEQERWMESKPALATAYALLALQAAYPEAPTPASRPRLPD